MKPPVFATYSIEYVDGLAARVAELEGREDAALSSLASKDARIELRRLENEAVRRQLRHAENACDAMEKRLAEMEARENQARGDEAWAKANDVTVATIPDGWIAFDSDVSRGVCGRTITDAVRALREKMENAKSEMGGAR